MQPSSPWARVVREKYCKGGDLSFCAYRNHPSNALKGVMENGKLLEEGVNVAIGDKWSTPFWQHRWTSKHLLTKVALGPIPGHEIDTEILDD